MVKVKRKMVKRIGRVKRRKFNDEVLDQQSDLKN